jgi:hypothetical protein
MWYVNEKLRCRGIGRGVTLNRPALYPDLSLLDYLVWDCMRFIMCMNGDDILHKNFEGIRHVNNTAVLLKFIHSLESRIGRCRHAHGEQFGWLI